VRPRILVPGLHINATTRALREKVFVTSDESVADRDSFVAVELTNGKKIKDHIEHAIGGYEKMLTVKFLKTKFMEQVGKRIREERAENA
jgi:aconitate decarboxylase